MHGVGDLISARIFPFTVTLVIAVLGSLPPSAQAAAWERPWGGTAGMLAAAAGVSLIPVPDQGSPWKNPVDSLSRSLLRDRAPEGRMRARLYTDIGLTIAVTAPIANSVFSGFQGESLRIDREEREWMAFTTVNALASNWLLTETLKRLTRRTRPRASSCNEDEPLGCLSSSDGQAHKSFPSGHTSFAFTGAGLLCLHHAQVRTGTPFLSGGAWCPAALGVATLTGLLRINADEHWFSDILMGAGTGLLSALVLAPAISGGSPSIQSRAAPLTAYPAIPVLMFLW
jgi:hypothetical protein